MLLHTWTVLAFACYFASAQFPTNGYNESARTTDSEDEPTDAPLPTLPNLDRYIVGMDVEVKADTLALLSWDVPEPIKPLVQKEYASYSAFCLQKESAHVLVERQTTSPVTIRPLESGVPYSCAVSFTHTLNSSRTDREEMTFFTRQLAPTGQGSITEIKYARINSTHVEFNWQEPSLTDARGVPHYELVIREGRMDHQVARHDLSAALAKLHIVRNVSTTNSTTVQDGLLSTITYTVQVRVYTAGGKGQYTYPREVPCSTCADRLLPSRSFMNTGILVALLVCLTTVSIMVLAAAILLFVVAKSYRRKRRLARAASDEQPIVIREEQVGEEELGDVEKDMPEF